MQDAWWECCWRLGKWEEALDSNETLLESHQMHIYSLFQAIHLRDLPAISNHIEAAKVQILQQLKMVSVESSSCLYLLLSNLQIISEMESVTRNQSSLDSRTAPQMVKNALELWEMRDLIKTENFEHREPVLAARVAFLNALQDHCDTDDALLQVLLLKSGFIRKTPSKGLDGCESVLVQASKLNVSTQLSNFRCLEIAQVAKARGDLRQASHILENLLHDLENIGNISDHEAHCQALSLYGEVLTKTRAKPPRTIITNYMERALTIMEEKGADEKNSNNLVAAYYQLAVFSEEWYLQVKEHLKSDTAKIKINNIKQSKMEAQRVSEVICQCKDEVERKELESKKTILSKNAALDQGYLQDLVNKKKDYLMLALKNYLKCLATAEDHDVHVYRVLALWFEHSSCGDVNALVCESIHRIKSHKWVPLLYQLVARLTNGKTEEGNGLFQSLLNNILEMVCQEHPHHGLPVLLALAHAHADDVKHKVAEEDRVQGAKQLVQKLKKQNIKAHVSEMETVCQAYLSLANWCMSKDKGKMGSQTPVTKIPSNQPLSKLRNLNYTGALTRPLQVQASGQYSPPCIANWDGTITLVGGINAPNKLTIITEDGVKSHELLKGRDDTRQDAVLEQVFGIVNKLLKKESESKSRRLSVRTYMVVPLSQRSGLIQWCENTQTFGDYLIGGDGKSGAHKMYCPTDWPAIVCRKNLQQARTKPREEKEKIFREVLSHLRPVFRHFFFENYPRPDVWYKRRLAYTNSVATNSMVGYILGLGDRHVWNILVDKQSAELIHIDLGIAFEFGKILQPPETVPFRLSQDIVDGMGVSGVEGVFRHGCEVTLQVLRNYAALLVTVVEVLRHDPLYTWTLSPQQIAKLQTASATSHQTLESNSVASMAERVVLRVQQKLAGLEEGQVWTVTEQVTSLINQATDIGNLSQLFPGWQPYL
ncbi:serine-protein kinase ATM-like [Oratosquilla oratoria]|uniref:serine-protein kinase ATM-like n=1 Tax=Oratosquilla oratoria TaxID=337810 RepID=UPI003F771FBB